MNIDKLILFYSSYSPYSREIIDYIQKKGIKSSFIFISADKNKERIPPQIDRVPALINPETGNILFEDAIFEFISKSFTDIMPLEQPSSGFSDNFTYLGEDDSGFPTYQGPSDTNLKNFASFGNEEHIDCPEADWGQKGQNSSQMHNVVNNESGRILDSVMNQRDMDIKSIFGDRRVLG